MKLISKLRLWKSSIITICLMIIVSFFVFQGCEKDEYELIDELDEAILNSSELEEYIIAGADLQQSLAIFKSKLNKIDFSKLEVTYDAEGKKVVHFSSGLVGNIRIEEKVQIFNDKKQALQKKFPQFVSFRETETDKYFQKSIENSVNVKGGLLKLGINFSIPKLKSGTETWGGAEDEYSMKVFLHDWCNEEDYVELAIYYYEDGTFGTYQFAGATSSNVDVQYYPGSDGKIYFPPGGSSSAIISIGHTHLNSSTPGTKDLTNRIPGVTEFIYYNWGMYYY